LKTWILASSGFEIPSLKSEHTASQVLQPAQISVLTSIYPFDGARVVSFDRDELDLAIFNYLSCPRLRFVGFYSSQSNYTASSETMCELPVQALIVLRLPVNEDMRLSEIFWIGRVKPDNDK
jgi:hypothetical protein